MWERLSSRLSKLEGKISNQASATERQSLVVRGLRAKVRAGEAEPELLNKVGAAYTHPRQSPDIPLASPSTSTCLLICQLVHATASLHILDSLDDATWPCPVCRTLLTRAVATGSSYKHFLSPFPSRTPVLLSHVAIRPSARWTAWSGGC